MSRPLQIVKSGKRGLIYVPIYPPWRVDTQTEAILPELLEKTAHEFAASGRMGAVKIAWQTREHEGAVPADARIVEIFIAQEDDPRFPVPGTWACAIQLYDPKLIEAVEQGQINAVSLESMFPPRRTPLPTLVRNPIRATGQTEPPLSGSVEPHTHEVNLEFDEHARIVPTQTSIEQGHRHLIQKPTAVEANQNHGHPLDLQKLTTDYQDVLQIVVWLSRLSVGAITLVEHAASWMPIVAMKGDNDMAGGIVQAIIVPEGTSLDLLKELLGEDFDKIRTDQVTQENGSTVYTLAQKADFESLAAPRAIRDTPISVVTGRLKAEKADIDLCQVSAAIEDYEEARKSDGASYGIGELATRLFREMKRLRREVSSQMESLAEKGDWSKAYQNSLPDDCFAVIEKGYDPKKKGMSDKGARHLPFRDADGNIDMPHLRNAMARANQLTSVLGTEPDEELRKRAQSKLAELAKKYLGEDSQANKGEENMSDYITKDDLNVALEGFAKKCGLIKDEPPAKKADTSVDVSEAIKPVMEAVQGLTNVVQSMLEEANEADQEAALKSGTFKSPQPKGLRALTAELEAMKADIEEAKTELATTKAVTEAIQRVGRPHIEVDPLSLKADGDKPADSAWQNHFEKRIMGARFGGA